MEVIGRQIYGVSGADKHLRKIKQHMGLDSNRISVKGKISSQEIKESLSEMVMFE